MTQAGAAPGAWVLAMTTSMAAEITYDPPVSTHRPSRGNNTSAGKEETDCKQLLSPEIKSFILVTMGKSREEPPTSLLTA